MKFLGTPTPFTTTKQKQVGNFLHTTTKFKKIKNKKHDQSSPLPHIMYCHKRKTKKCVKSSNLPTPYATTKNQI
jgi:hypothetical protein